MEMLNRLNEMYAEAKMSFPNFIYTRLKDKVAVFCEECDETYYNTVASLLGRKYKRCAICTGAQKTVKSVRKELNRIHEGKYTFDEFIYTGQYKKGAVYCVKCGTYEEHTYTQAKNAIPCSACVRVYLSKKRALDPYTALDSIMKKQAYTVDLSSFTYIKPHVISEVTCLVCNHTFKASYANLTAKTPKKCPECSNKHTNSYRMPTQTKAHESVQERLGQDYSLRYFRYHGRTTRVPIACHICGRVTRVEYCRASRKSYVCVCQRLSLGAKKVHQYLATQHVQSALEETFDACRDIRCLPFDFYIPEYDLLIEYHGELHYIACANRGGEAKLKSTQKHDAIKKSYAEKHHNFLEIPYWDFNNIETILEAKLKELKD